MKKFRLHTEDRDIIVEGDLVVLDDGNGRAQVHVYVGDNPGVGARMPSRVVATFAPGKVLGYSEVPGA